MNNEIVSFKVLLNPVWDKVREIRNHVDNTLKDYPTDLREASVMTASELIENGIKHSASDRFGVHFNLHVGDDKISISVENKVRSTEDLDVFISNVDEIKKSENPMDLYLERLMELSDDPKKSKTRLGLYRIAYEGEFNIDYKLDGDILTVIGSRGIE